MKKEGQMFLYTLVDSLEAVMSVMCRSFGISQIRKTNRLELENGSISMIVTGYVHRHGRRGRRAY